MRRNMIKVVLGLLVATVFGLSGCGGGGGSDTPSVTPISQSVTGTYVLKSATYDYVKSTGELLNSTYTPASTPPMSGSMTLNATTWTQNFTLTDGSPLIINGTYAFTATTSNAGNYVIRNAYGTSTYTGTYNYSDPTRLTTIETPGSVTTSGGTYFGGTSYTWTKISN